MRIPNNTLKQFVEVTGISVVLLCDYLAERRNMSKARALELGCASKKLGYDFTASDWMFSPEKIKQALTSQEVA